MTVEQILSKVVEYGLPALPEGRPTGMRWIAASNDWWVRIDHRWFWLDGRGGGCWKRALSGPPY